MTAIPATTDSLDVPAARQRTAYGPLLLLGLSVLTATAARQLFSTVQEAAKGDLHLSDFQLSLVQGLAASIPIALLSIPVGRLVDRVHRVRIMVAMMAIASFGTALTAIADGFALLFTARMLVGLAGVCALPAAISIAADYSSHDKRGRALFWLSLGVMAGAAIAFAAGGKLYGALSTGVGPEAVRHLAPWRGVHVAFAIAAAAVMLALFLIREPARHELGEAAGLGFRAALHAIWVRRALLLPLFVGQVTAVMADTAAGIWAAPVLSRNYGQRPQDFAGWMGAVILAAGVIGSVLGAVTADLGHKSRIGGGLLLSAVVAAAVAVPAAFYPVMPSVTGFAWMLLVFLICGSIAGLVTATAIAVLVPNELRGMCLGAFVVIAGIIGFGLAPTLVSSISTTLGGEHALGEALGWTGAAASVIGLGGFALAFRALRRGAIAEPRHD